MITQDSGHIVTVASLAGLTGSDRLVDYCASKFAAVGFDESLRTELAVCLCQLARGESGKERRENYNLFQITINKGGRSPWNQDNSCLPLSCEYATFRRGQIKVDR